MEFIVGAKLFTYCPPIQITIGVIFNTITFYLYCNEFFNKTSSSFYLRALTITDTISITQSIFFMANGLNNDVKLYTPFACKIINYLLYVTSPCSAWIETFISIDRAINIVYPTRFSILKNRNFNLIIVFIIVMYTLVYYAPILYFYGHVFTVDDSQNVTNSTVSYRCDSTNPDYLITLGLMDLLNSTLLPFTIMTISSIITLRHIFNSRNNLKHKKNAKQNTYKLDGVSNKKENDQIVHQGLTKSHGTSVTNNSSLNETQVSATTATVKASKPKKKIKISTLQ